MKNKFQVDFIGVGAAKCGTGWVAQCLREHPEVSLSRIKEVTFFNKQKGIYSDNKEWNYTKGFQWYRSHFPNEKGKIKGEISVDYLYDKETPKLIKENFPRVKIIICLRNPVDRTYSHYIWLKDNFKKEKANSFEEALETQPEYIKRSLYYDQLKRYYNIFPDENILVILTDNMKKEPRATAKKLFKFLGINYEFIPPSLNKNINSARKVRFESLTVIFSIIEKLRKKGMGPFFKILKNIGVYQFFQTIYTRINTKEFKYPKMKSSTRKKLEKIFRKDLLKVEKLIGMNLGSWRGE